MKTLISTRVEAGESNVRLSLHWSEAGGSYSYRIAQADTFRVAALVCRDSGNWGWCVIPDVGCEIIGRARVATSIKLELSTGSDAEKAAAVAVLESVAREIKGGA